MFRYADGIVVSLEHQADAERFWEVVKVTLRRRMHEMVDEQEAWPLGQ
jgi:hypothetical protein